MGLTQRLSLHSRPLTCALASWVPPSGAVSSLTCWTHGQLSDCGPPMFEKPSTRVLHNGCRYYIRWNYVQEGYCVFPWEAYEVRFLGCVNKDRLWISLWGFISFFADRVFCAWWSIWIECFVQFIKLFNWNMLFFRSFRCTTVHFESEIWWKCTMKCIRMLIKK